MADVKAITGDNGYAESTGKSSDPENAAVRVGSHAAAFSDETVQVVDKDAEKKLCRKFDFRLLPVLAIMVFLCIISIKLPVVMLTG
jgi:hypothetical protein